jgi:DNA-binding NarL/FixJ family response regulator
MRPRWLGSNRSRTKPLTVLVASPSDEDRKKWTDSLAGTDGISLAGEVHSAPEALDGLKRRPDVLLLDARLLVEHGTTLVTVIRRTSRRTRILLLAGDTAHSLLIEAMCRGAVGYVDQNAAAESLVKAVRVIHAGQVWIPRGRVSDLVDRLIQLAPRRVGHRRRKT